MINMKTTWAVLGIVLVLGCASRTTTKTTPDESVEHEDVPLPPKSRADHLDREFDAE